MTYSSLDGAWSEFCFITVCEPSGTPKAIQNMTETVDIDIGEKNFDVIACLSGARVIKFTPAEPTTITFEAYATQAGTATGSTGYGFFDFLNKVDSSQPLDITLDKTRTKYRVAVLWTDDPAVTTADVTTSATKNALRVVAVGYFISVKPSHTDGILKWTVVFKAAPFDSNAKELVKIESTNATAALPALASYTGSYPYW